MNKTPIRLNVTALGNRIVAGRPNKAMDGFIGEPDDVTNDAIDCIIKHFGLNTETVLSMNGKPAVKLTILEIREEG